MAMRPDVRRSTASTSSKVLISQWDGWTKPAKEIAMLRAAGKLGQYEQEADRLEARMPATRVAPGARKASTRR